MVVPNITDPETLEAMACQEAQVLAENCGVRLIVAYCRVGLYNWMIFINHVWVTYIVYKGLWPRDHTRTLYK
jgi:hypothetical protein